MNLIDSGHLRSFFRTTLPNMDVGLWPIETKRSMRSSDMVLGCLSAVVALSGFPHLTAFQGHRDASGRPSHALHRKCGHSGTQIEDLLVLLTLC